MKVKNVISTIVTIALTVLILFALTRLFERKESREKNQSFMTEEHQFDVLYFGTSHMKNGIYPMTIWEDYGITGFNWGCDGHALPTSYWVMMNAFKYNVPKVVVIDCYYLSKMSKSDDTYQLHQSMDAFPLSVTKIRGIMDILDDPVWDEERAMFPKDEDEPRHPMYFLWDFANYHTRWDGDLTIEDFYIEENLEKGAITGLGVEPGEEIVRIDSEQMSAGDTTGALYLRKMIEECQKRGIDVVLTYLPGSIVDYRQMEANTARQIADEYGIKYVNFLNLDVIDCKTDMFNHGGGDNAHLNTSGARKVSRYMGDFLVSNFELYDKRNDDDYNDWKEADLKFINYENYLIQTQNDISTYLSVLAGDNVEVTAKFSSEALVHNKELKEGFFNLISTGKADVSVDETVENNTTPSVSVEVYRKGEQIDKVTFNLEIDNQNDRIISCQAFR